MSEPLINIIKFEYYRVHVSVTVRTYTNVYAAESHLRRLLGSRGIEYKLEYNATRNGDGGGTIMPIIQVNYHFQSRKVKEVLEDWLDIIEKY
jgi:hypothetical protein